MNLSITGQDVLILQDRIFTDFAQGDTSAITFPNELATVETGKNGNSIYAKNEAGRQGEMTLRLLRASADDKFLNNLLTLQKADFANTSVLRGQFTKKVGDGNQNITNDQYLVSGGIFTKNVDVKENASGDVEQSISIYTIRFANVDRVVG